MKKVIIVTSMIFALLINFIEKSFSQTMSIVTAPNLEMMTSSNLAVQSKTLIESTQSQLNTLNTSKNTLESLDKLKEIDERITKVSATLKQARVVYNIFSVAGQFFQNAKKTNSALNKNNKGVNTKYASEYLTMLQTSVDDADNIVGVCKDIMSESYKMNDYERLNMLNGYYDKLNSLNLKVAQLHKSFVNIVAINKL